MDMLSVSLAIFFLIVAYILFDKYMGTDRVTREALGENASPAEVGENSSGKESANEDGTVKETVYTMDYYPWWRSTRWWNYDGWLYQKP